MKNLYVLSYLLVLSNFSIFAQSNTAYFVSDPTLSPDGKFIIFSYEGDLWKVDSNGGTAYRLTAMDGVESHPRISPDGKWLAFSSTLENNANVYLIPINGGEIKQLTYHDADDFVDSWSWDSQSIYFTSNRYNLYTGFKISATGGTPVRLFSNYFNTPHHLVEDPLTKSIYFTESWESNLFAHRKKYKGAHNPDIKSYNMTTKEFKKLTNYNGKDFWPTVDSKGRIYFVSDQKNGEYNLAVLNSGKTEILTSFESSIGRPRVSANGEKVVFVKDYSLYIYDVGTKTSKLLDISLYQNNTLKLEQSFKVSGKISYFDVSPDGEKMAFVSRGVLFVSDIDGKFVKQIKTNPGERVIEVKWMADNLTLFFSQTTDGWSNWYTIRADVASKQKQITFDKSSNRGIAFNEDRSKAVYLSGRNFVKIMNMSTFSPETVVEDEIWAFRDLQPRFSPDGNYIVFTAYRDFEQDVFIYSLLNKSTINLTNSGVTETEPFWSPDGKYIYLISDRYQPSYPRGMKNASMYRIPLDKFEAAFKLDKYGELFKKEEDKEETKKKGKGKKEKKSEEKPKLNISIHLENIAERWESLAVEGGQQYSPYVIDKEGESNVIFVSNRDKGKWELWNTTIKDFEKRKTEKIEGTETQSYSICEAKDKIYLLRKGNIHKLNLSDKKLTKIDIDFSFAKKLDDEFRQLFYETWTTLQENFYDKDFHGMDWDKIKNKYEKYLPHIRNRGNLRTILNEMLGELNSSHLGFYSNGDEEKRFYKMHSLSTGIIFEEDEPFKVKYIVNNSTSDKKENQIKKGDILTAVNGIQVDTTKNRESYFIVPQKTDEISLSFQRANKVFEQKVHSQNSRKLNTLLYDEWIQDNQNYVDKTSNRQIAYIHMKNMSTASLNQFLIEMSNEDIHRDALILDLRYNRGGNVHQEVLNYLSQKPYFKWKYREGKKTTHPNVTPSAKPIVLLINEHSLSDAEVTANGFKELKLGKIIGTETYRWIIFTSGRRLVDGSFCRIPAWGCYTLDGKDLEFEGVKPDIFVDTNFKDRLENADPQIDKAIEFIMQELK